jgi:hypothetical protein
VATDTGLYAPIPPVFGPAFELRAIGHGEHRDLLSLEKILDDDDPPRLAEPSLTQHGPDYIRGLPPAEADDRAFSGGEPRGLHHQRLGVPLDVGQRRAQILKGMARGGGDPGDRHELLGERLRGLDLGSRGTRSKDRVSLRPEAIGQSPRERDLGPDHGEIDALHVGRVGQPVEVVGGDREVDGELGGSRISGRAVEVGVRVLSAEGPAERVLPAPAADDQKPHGF